MPGSNLVEVPRSSLVARLLNTLLGAWLVASAFLWPELRVERASTLVMGALCAIVALAALRFPRLHWWNAAVAVALIVTVWALPHARAASQWNDGVSGFLVLFIALVPGAGEIDDDRAASSRARA